MTKAELRDHILRQLGVLGAADTAKAEDAVFIETVIDNAQDELEQLEVALWTVDDVPGYAIESFVAYCVPMAGPAYGYPADLNVKAVALSHLRHLTADRRSTTGRATYY